jgi:hypothetical protein
MFKERRKGDIWQRLGLRCTPLMAIDMKSERYKTQDTQNQK